MELIWVITVGQGRFPPSTGDDSSEVTDAAVLSLYRESNKFALVSHISYIHKAYGSLLLGLNST